MRIAGIMLKMKNKKEWNKRYYKNHPWAKTFSRISSRCNSKNNAYHKRGIKNFLKVADLKFLWFRDRAFLMKKPSIDRIDTKGNYSLENCHYMELHDNIVKGHFIGRNYKKISEPRKKKISQFFKNNIKIRNFNSIAEAERILKICSSSIGECASGKRKSAGGFVWKYRRDNQ